MQLPGRDTDLYREARHAANLLIKGNVVAIDPSVGSTSSMPGWAIYLSGRLAISGTFDIPIGRPLSERLQILGIKLRSLYKTYNPDVLVYEDIPSQRYGGGNAEAHASLLKAVGAILAVRGPRATVGMKPTVWKRLVRDTYVKGDREDAEEMGWIAIEVAKEMEQKDPPGNYGQRRRAT